jgi:hypothetical protein
MSFFDRLCNIGIGHPKGGVQICFIFPIVFMTLSQFSISAIIFDVDKKPVELEWDNV